ncbi:hypothetical protein B0H21DRAFT_717413 [Amylocystis lapponica]|nr:hypothetical protein B0H21DRAFT_717413 [Amylocystis lapponica]
MVNIESSDRQEGMASRDVFAHPGSVLTAEALLQPNSEDEALDSGDPKSQSALSETVNRDPSTSIRHQSPNQGLRLLYGGFALSSSSEDESEREDEVKEASPELPRQRRQPDRHHAASPVGSNSQLHVHTASRRRPPARRSNIIQSSSSDDEGSDEPSLSTNSEKAPEPLSRRRAPLDRSLQAVHANGDGQTDQEALGKTVNIPKTAHARGRRLLAPSGSALPYVTIAMRGDVQFIDKSRQVRISGFSLPWPDEVSTSDAHVTDACLLGDRAVVVGYDSGPRQVSVITLGDEPPRRFNIRHRAHTIIHENRVTGSAHPYRGVSVLAPLSETRFLSGGHDKTVHLWTVMPTAEGFAAKSQRLNIEHSRCVQALAYRAHDNSVLSASGECVSTMRLSSHLPPDPIRVSGRVLHIHVHPQAPHFVVLEVAHMDRQVQLYDLRKAGFERAPCVEFGYRSRDDKHTDSRYVRGSPWNSLFARGYADGAVRVWDYRQATNVMIRVQCQRPAPVAHTLLSSSDIIAYGGHSVTFWSLNGGRS